MSDWPPIIPVNNRANATPRENNHPSDHNVTVNALAAISTGIGPTDVVTQVQPIMRFINTQFGGSGQNWKMQVTHYPSVTFVGTTPTILTLPAAFPTGEVGAWAFLSTGPGGNLFTQRPMFAGMFPGGNHQQISARKVAGGTIAYPIGVIAVALYP